MVGNYLFLVYNDSIHYALCWQVGGTLRKCKKVTYAGNVGKVVVAVDAVCSECSKHSECSGHSKIVVYGDGDIVFGAKRSNHWMQWMQYVVDTVDAVE